MLYACLATYTTEEQSHDAGASWRVGTPRHDLARAARSLRPGSAVRCISSIIVAGIVGPLLTRDRLIVAGDAAATAQNIAALPELWRLGVAADVVMQLCDVPVMLILFPLLSPINRNVALLAILFNIVQTATLVANS